MDASVVFPSPGGPYSKTWSNASPRDLAASIATAKFSLTLDWPMNSPSRCGRSFSSNEESSSTGAAETSRSRSSGSLGIFLTVATGAIVTRSRRRQNGQVGARWSLQSGAAERLAERRVRGIVSAKMLHGPVAFAGGILQTLPVQNFYCSAQVFNHAGALQQSGGKAHTGPPGAQHLREKVMRHGEQFGVHAVLAH